MLQIIQSMRRLLKASKRERWHVTRSSAHHLPTEILIDVLKFFSRKSLAKGIHLVNLRLARICEKQLDQIQVLPFLVFLSIKNRTISVKKRRMEAFTSSGHPIHFGALNDNPSNVEPWNHGMETYKIRKHVKINEAKVILSAHKPPIDKTTLSGWSLPTNHLEFGRVMLTCQLSGHILQFFHDAKAAFSGCQLELRFPEMTGQIEPQIESLLSYTFDQCYSIMLKKNFAVDFLRLANTSMCDRLELDWHCAYSTTKYLSNWNRHLHGRVNPTEYLLEWLYFKRGSDYTRYLEIGGPVLTAVDVSDLVSEIKQEFMESRTHCNFHILLHLEASADLQPDHVNQETQETLSFFAGERSHDIASNPNNNEQGHDVLRIWRRKMEEETFRDQAF